MFCFFKQQAFDFEKVKCLCVFFLKEQAFDFLNACYVFFLTTSI